MSRSIYVTLCIYIGHAPWRQSRFDLMSKVYAEVHYVLIVDDCVYYAALSDDSKHFKQILYIQ